MNGRILLYGGTGMLGRALAAECVRGIIGAGDIVLNLVGLSPVQRALRQDRGPRHTASI